MTIDVYSATGQKKETLSLPDSLFAAPVNHGLMHQALVAQQSNRRTAVAHVKTRGEVVGSTRKLFQQKGTGRARRGPGRSPVLRGGGKAFGPRNNRNFIKEMPKMMRRKALVSCLSFRAREEGTLLGLASYDGAVKTKDFHTLLSKLPVDIGRRILVVLPEKNDTLRLSGRNIPGVQTVLAAYLNPEDVLGAHRIIFVGDAVAKAEEVFAASRIAASAGTASDTDAPKAASKTTAPRKRTAAKKSTKSSSSAS